METNKELIRAEFEAWVTKEWRPDDGAKLLAKEWPHFAFAAWQAALAARQSAPAIPHNKHCGCPSCCDAAPVASAPAVAVPDSKVMLVLLQDAARAWNNEQEAELDATMERVESFLIKQRRAPQPAAAPQPPADAGPAWETIATQRLRSIVDLLGLQSVMPEGDLTGYEFAVLGFVRREIERLKAAPVDAVNLIVRDVAELDYSSDTVLDLMQVSEADLRIIIQRHVAAQPSPAQGEALVELRLADAKAEIKYWKQKAVDAGACQANAPSRKAAQMPPLPRRTVIYPDSDERCYVLAFTDEQMHHRYQQGRAAGIEEACGWLRANGLHRYRHIDVEAAIRALNK